MVEFEREAWCVAVFLFFLLIFWRDGELFGDSILTESVWRKEMTMRYSCDRIGILGLFGANENCIA